jgi:hypothetical protein
MPKNTKPKTNSTNKGLMKSFSLKSRKVQFFVVVLIFGIIGGGYMVYRSYAAIQGQQWVYEIPNGYMQVPSGSISGEAKKNGKQVAVLNSGNAITASVPGSEYPKIDANQPYRLCLLTNNPNPQFMITQKNSAGKLKYHGNSSATLNAQFSLNEAEYDQNSGYYLLCTFKRTRAETTVGPITFTNKGSSTKISGVVIRFVDGSTTGKVKNW